MTPELPQPNQVPIPPAQPEEPLPTPPSNPQRWLPWALAVLVLIVVSATAGFTGYRVLGDQQINRVIESENTQLPMADKASEESLPAPSPLAKIPSQSSSNLTEGFLGVDTTKLVPWPTVSDPQSQHSLNSLLSVVPQLNQGVPENSDGQLENSFHIGQDDDGTLQIEWIEQGGKRTLIDPLLTIVNDVIKITAQYPSEIKLSNTATVSLRELPQSKISLTQGNQRYDFEFFVKKTTGEGAPVSYFGVRIQSQAFPVLDGYYLDEETHRGYILFLADNLILTARENKAIGAFERLIITAAPEPYAGDPRCLPGIPKGDCDLLHEFQESGQHIGFWRPEDASVTKRLNSYYKLDDFPASLFFRK